MYRCLSVITIAAVFFLILVGSIVRASGAGMGCPDWPKCFGQWIPPTSEAQLPEDYQEIYADRGYSDTTFNAAKTWMEYVNRLLGVAIGLLIFATLLASLTYRRSAPAVTGLSLAAFLLVGFQGWLGARVVASNLAANMITVHMLVALLIVSILILAAALSAREALASVTAPVVTFLQPLVVICLVLSLLQVVLGTHVRQEVDALADLYTSANRNLWVENLGKVFSLHRSFALVVALANGLLAWKLLRYADSAPLFRRCAWGLLAIVVASVVSGATLYYADMPAFLQPVHLLLANLMFGLQVYLLVALHYAIGPQPAEQR